MKNPNTDDKAKLQRILDYLRKTRLLPLRLSADRNLLLRAYADASYAVHENGMGQTGGYLTVGKGVISWKSVKQKLVCRSSCESELVAQVEILCEALHVRNFLSTLKISTGPLIMYQDNLSTIAVSARGRKNMKHLQARFFFTKDRVEKGEVTLEHLSTDQMPADLLTKPLQGSKFEEFRNVLLNNSQIKGVCWGK